MYESYELRDVADLDSYCAEQSYYFDLWSLSKKTERGGGEECTKVMILESFGGDRSNFCRRYFIALSKRSTMFHSIILSKAASVFIALASFVCRIKISREMS